MKLLKRPVAKSNKYGLNSITYQSVIRCIYYIYRIYYTSLLIKYGLLHIAVSYFWIRALKLISDLIQGKALQK